MKFMIFIFDDFILYVDSRQEKTFNEVCKFIILIFNFPLCSLRWNYVFIMKNKLRHVLPEKSFSLNFRLHFTQ